MNIEIIKCELKNPNKIKWEDADPVFINNKQTFNKKYFDYLTTLDYDTEKVKDKWIRNSPIIELIASKYFELILELLKKEKSKHINLFIKALIRKDPNLLIKKNKKNETILHIFAKTDNLPLLQYGITKCKELHPKYSSNVSVLKEIASPHAKPILYYAVKYESFEILNWSIEHAVGALYHTKDNLSPIKLINNNKNLTNLTKKIAEKHIENAYLISEATSNH